MRATPLRLTLAVLLAAPLAAGACDQPADDAGSSPAARVAGTAARAPAEPTADGATQTGTTGAPATPPPIDGRARVDVRDIAQLPQRGVVPPGGGGLEIPPVSGRAVDRFVATVTDWLDAHLTAVHRGADLGRLADTRLADGPTGALKAVTTDLAGPRRALTDVRYDIRVYARGEPKWAHVRITTVGEDGSRRAGALMLEPGDQRLIPLAGGPVGTADG